MQTIKTLFNLKQRNERLAQLEAQGLTSSDEAESLRDSKVELDPNSVEDETSGNWRWVTLFYDSNSKSDFFNQCHLLEDAGHLCILPELNTDRANHRCRVSTDLTDENIRSIFQPFSMMRIIIPVAVKTSSCNNWWRKQ